jgi:predicted ATP-dependent serine protease
MCADTIYQITERTHHLTASERFDLVSVKHELNDVLKDRFHTEYVTSACTRCLLKLNDGRFSDEVKKQTVDRAKAAASLQGWSQQGEPESGSSGKANFASKKVNARGIDHQETPLNQGQQDVLKTAVGPQHCSGSSLFFSGEAGTGKSFCLKRIIAELRRKPGGYDKGVYVTAPTALAASALGGTTIHSFAGIGSHLTHLYLDLEFPA